MDRPGPPATARNVSFGADPGVANRSTSALQCVPAGPISCAVLMLAFVWQGPPGRDARHFVSMQYARYHRSFSHSLLWYFDVNIDEEARVICRS
jgi:hypothetical protein